MSKTAHRLYILGLISIILIFLFVIVYKGFFYYKTSIEERFFNSGHHVLKPSGLIGHGLGILGSLLMIFGVTLYMVRKRYRVFSRLGILKHWLELHIFLCTIGPIMVLFHTTFKFGGIVAVSFWSMVAVFVSGIIGRFIYIQIPRTIEGRELSLSEVKDMKTDIGAIAKGSLNLDDESYNVIVESVKKKVELYHKIFFIRFFRKYLDDLKTIRNVRTVLKKNKLSKDLQKQVLVLVKNDISLNRRIERLATMQNLFKYWHVAHLPFALVMLVIMIIHVGITIAFGYKWIF